jgi:lipopolysaccharide/colanic/teichoic acid biosynthesis glycosyltransferase
MAKSINKNLTIPFLLIDFIIVNIAFFSMNYFKRGKAELDIKYLKLLFLFYGVWFGISYFTKKFKISSYPDYKHAFLLIIKSNTFILYTLSIVIVLQGLYAFSRIQLFGTCLFLLILEMSVFSLFYFTTGKKLITKNGSEYALNLRFKNFSLLRFFSDITAISLSFFVLNYYKRGTFELSPEYEELYLVVFALWLVSSLFTRKYERIKARNYYYAIAPYIKSFIFATAVMSVIVFAFRMFFYSRLHIFGAFVLTLFLESLIFYIYYIFKSKSSPDQDIETFQEVKQIIEQEDLPFELEKINKLKNREIRSIKDKLKSFYLKEHSKLFKFINDRINLLKIDETDTCVLNTHTLYNVQTIENHSVSLFINLHKLNDIRYLNRYFLEIHRKIYNGGFLIGKVDTIATHRTRFYKKYSKTLAEILYPFSFLFKRVIPKLPGFKDIYFFITRGRNRVISKAEALGRLYFCGFKVVDVREISESLYFIAQRVKHPSVEKNPSYGPVVKLKRIGFNNEVIQVYKLRTMHPYSEFLQEYIYEAYGTKNGDKFNNDFRVTNWGEFFRKFWIDEFPMFINYFRGDLKIVGVRPLSIQKFSIYRSNLQKLRTKHKPGMVPPFYADMPDTLEGLMDSEEKYLRSYEKNPLITDIKYFIKAFYNIIFKQARSH